MDATILSQIGLLNVAVDNLEDGVWVARLVGEHPIMSRLGNTSGTDAETALRNLELAVQNLSSWRAPA